MIIRLLKENVLMFILLLSKYNTFSQDKIPQVGQEYNGGIIVFKEGDHGLVISKNDLPNGMIWEQAIYEGNKINIAGFTGWRLPNNMEWIKIYKFWKATKKGNFSEYNVWWSATEGVTTNGKRTAYLQYFTDGSQTLCTDRNSAKYSVRFVLSF